MAKKAPKSKSAAKKPTAKKSKPSKAQPKKAAAKAPVSKAAAKAPKIDPKAAARAKAMAAFSSKVLTEEEAPVAVRSFIEARQGIEKSQELNAKTGEVSARVDLPPSNRPSAEPRADPLSGPVAVPRPQNEEFKIRERATPKKGQKAVTPEDFGQVELRQATASGAGRHLTTAKPENLQRGAGRIKPLTSGEDDATPSLSKKSKGDFVVGSQGGAKADLSDFGEVEIGQQTLKGSKKIGTLKKDDE
jgi:hypothetical protein